MIVSKSVSKPTAQARSKSGAKPPSPQQSPDKPINQMNRLADMGHFPVAVNAGATVNVLLTLAVTWFVVPHFPQPWAPVLWVAAVLSANLLPVILLRISLTSATPYPRLREMNFFHDQHKFSDWVYVTASANMAFWVLSGWALFAWYPALRALAGMLLLAALVTFSPVLLRGRGR